MIMQLDGDIVLKLDGDIVVDGEYDAEATQVSCLISIAVSMKRIADAVTEDIPKRLASIENEISGLSI